MGMTYVLMRDDTREQFQLNKGNWGRIFPIALREDSGERMLFEIRNIASVAGVLAERIRTEVFGHPIADHKGDMTYHELVATRIWAWCGHAKVWCASEENPDRWLLNYTETADRFNPTNVEGYKEPAYEPEPPDADELESNND